MTLEKIQQYNPQIKVYSITDSSFLKYGKVITGYNFAPLKEIMENRPIPTEGNCYTACDSEMLQTSLTQELSHNFYGNMDIQIGYCNGNSSKLNAFEYHKGSEIDVAVTDLVLLLGSLQDIRHNVYSSSLAEAFFIPAGTACELYGTTLHFAPCKVSSSGYKSIIILPLGTNEPLLSSTEPLCEEDRLLWMKNKWLIAHKESIPASKGAFIGIDGVNVEIFYK